MRESIRTDMIVLAGPATQRHYMVREARDLSNNKDCNDPTSMRLI